MKTKLLFVVSFLAITMAACGLLERKSRSPAPLAPTVQDVPFEARPPTGDMRKRIMVLPFLDEKLQRSQEVRETARRTVVQELIATQQFLIISDEEFPQDLSKYITQQNEYDLVAIAKVAAGMGISGIVEGKVLEVKAKRIGDQVGLIREVRAQVETTVRTRIASSRNGRIIFDETKNALVEDSTTKFGDSSAFSDRYLEEDPTLVRLSVQKAFKTMVGGVIKAIDKISWEGRVAMVSGERIFLNAGRMSGIQVGDILKISEDGQEVYDPENGTFIGFAPGRMKGTIEVVTYFGKDGSVAVVHSGSGFKENDKVELY